MDFKRLLVTHSAKRFITFLWPGPHWASIFIRFFMHLTMPTSSRHFHWVSPPVKSSFFPPGSEEDWLTSLFPPGFSPHSSSFGWPWRSGGVCMQGMEEFCLGKGH